MNATITATAHYVPKKTLTNYDLEKFLDTSDEWIFKRSGIKSRHVVSENENTSDLAYKAEVIEFDQAGVPN